MPTSALDSRWSPASGGDPVHAKLLFLRLELGLYGFQFCLRGKGLALSIIIASTEGNVSVPDREEKVGLNVYRKK